MIFFLWFLAGFDKAGSGSLKLIGPNVSGSVTLEKKLGEKRKKRREIKKEFIIE